MDADRAMLELLAFVQNQVVAEDLDKRDRGGRIAIERFEKFDEVFLPLPWSTDSGDLTAPSIKSSEQLKGAAPLILMLEANGKSGPGRASGARSGPRPQGGLLIQAKNALMRFKIPRVEIANVLGSATKLLISRCLGTQPVVHAPRLESVRGQNALDRLWQGGLNQPVPPKGTSQFRAAPRVGFASLRQLNIGNRRAGDRTCEACSKRHSLLRKHLQRAYPAPPCIRTAETAFTSFEDQPRIVSDHGNRCESSESHTPWSRTRNAFSYPSSTMKKTTMSAQEKVRVRAPEIAGGRAWLNTDKPLSLAAFKGKVVLLDFWTYGCINCIHIIPDLRRLEAKYPDQLVVIGVHSAKFENEKETENIRRIILRYEIEHPVYNDAEFKVWQSYGVRAWPTQVLIDPAGYVIGAVSGEGNYELIDQVVAKSIDESRKRGELKEAPLKLTLERAAVGDLPLAFPGKILADAKSDHLFIADSNHNRLVITKLDGTFVETIGTGERGAGDGPADKSSFYRPQGLALDGDSLYVADTENHLIRKVNLKTRTVQTVAGTGQQSRNYFQTGPARTIALSSPWDLQLVGRQLYVAMAGLHQIWKLDLDKQEVSTFAGSGREARQDGRLADAGFAQPSGIASEGAKLYVADSESNIIRGIDLASGEVETLVGGDLFEFGDVDGAVDEVRLQHPLGVVALGGKILIADTYNHKIKELDLQARWVRTLLGAGKPGQTDGLSPSFYEPGGLTVANGKLYVADTNNHAVRVVDLKTKTTSTLNLKGLKPPPAVTSVQSANNDEAVDAEEIAVAAQTVSAHSKGELVVNVELPTGYHLSPAAPQRYRVQVEGGPEHFKFFSAAITGADGHSSGVSETSKNLKLPLRISFQAFEPGVVSLRLEITLFYCREDNTGVCRIETLAWRLPVEVKGDVGTTNEIKLQGKLAAG